MFVASNARARSASSSATGERTGGAIQSIANLEVVVEIGGAIRVRRVCAKAPCMFEQRGRRPPGEGPQGFSIRE